MSAASVIVTSLLRAGVVFVLLGALTEAAAAQDGVVRVPAFDHEGVEASYVVSVPKGYVATEKWPLILDFHGAAPPQSRGAIITRERIWSAFVGQVPCIVVGLSGRTRAWNSIRGEKNDTAYALHVLEEVKRSWSIDPARIYLAGFSSGSDFLCSGGLQLAGTFAGSLVVCPGPPSVVGLRDGSLATAKGHPFCFVAGEEDYIRKDGAWQAFLEIEGLGGRVTYREVPGLLHVHPTASEMAVAFRQLEVLAGKPDGTDELARATDAIARGDFLLASTVLSRAKGEEAKALLEHVEAQGKQLSTAALILDAVGEPGRAYEAWWQIRTQFHRFPEFAARAQKEMDAVAAAQGNRPLMTARRDWFDRRKARAARQSPASRPADSRPGVADATSRPTVTRLWTFDRYLTLAEIEERLRDLAARFPDRARLSSMGRSIEGRDLWVLEVTDRSAGAAGTKPGVYIQGGLHGNEISTTMNVLHMAWQLAANPGRRRGVERLLTNTTFYLAPAVSPDAVHHYFADPNTHWRPRFNFRPHDSDGDGKTDEDPYEDLDGDGEVGQMYRPDPKGDFILKDGRLVRGEGEPRYTPVGREGIDNDGDGRFSEDPPGGVNLNRNFPVGFGSRKDFEGTTGAGPASEPETRAIVDFVSAHPDVALFLDYHNDANCVFYWTSADSGADRQVYEAMAGRAQEKLGYRPAALTHGGAGLSIAWSYGELGILSALVELESVHGNEEDYLRTKWGEDVFIKARPFKHPQLGDILLGNDHKKVPKRNLHPSDLLGQVQKNWEWLQAEVPGLARVALENPRIERTEGGFVVTGNVVNTGKLATDTALAAHLRRSAPVVIEAEGATVTGEASLGTLAGGERRAFRVTLEKPSDSVTLLVRHPRGGTVRFPVTRGKLAGTAIRKTYRVEEGYATPDAAKRANNEFFADGRSEVERGPAFRLTHNKSELKIAVILGEWKDQRHAVDADVFREAFFSERKFVEKSPTGQTVYGSVRDFYDEMSYGALKVTGKVFDWLELPGVYAEYRDASFGSSIVSDRMLEAIRSREDAGVFDEFDGIAFVWAGNAVQRTSALWPMRLKLKDPPDKVAFKMGEFHQGEMAPIGVPCHELGHTFGVDDKYGLGAGNDPQGEWCLMCRGTHGAEPSGRHQPFHMCAWCKMVIGWVKPAVIDPKVPQKLALRSILYAPTECYRILLESDGSEYLLLENRRREGFFSHFPSGGLAVYRVGPNDKPASPQTRVQLVPAHGLAPTRRGIVARPETVAWPQEGKTEFTVKGVRVSGIRLVDDVVYFEVGPAGK